MFGAPIDNGTTRPKPRQEKVADSNLGAGMIYLCAGSNQYILFFPLNLCELIFTKSPSTMSVSVIISLTNCITNPHKLYLLCYALTIS